MDKKGPMPQKQRSESPELTLSGIQQVFSEGVGNTGRKKGKAPGDQELERQRMQGQVWREKDVQQRDARGAMGHRR